ncbi:MAG: sugar transferase [Nitrospirota bacterium]|nr:sugar transferase [Nitrospirota bacterium]
MGRKFIKRYNLDELPQFIKVLKGEVSIVGLA